MKLHIRQEVESDYPEVFQLIKAAFKQDTEAKLVEALRRSNGFVPELSLVATLDNKIAGHILFTRIKIRSDYGDESESLTLAPLAVKPELQNKGIGGQLITTGLRIARDLGHKSVIVLGHEHYYPKFGFVPAKKWNIHAPFEVPENAFMGIELVPDGLKNVAGTVIFPKEFET